MTPHGIQKLIVLAFSVLSAVSFSLFAEPKPILKYNLNGSSTWVPYYIKNGGNKPGILREFIPRMLDKAGIEGQVLEFPPRRTNQALQRRQLDFDIVSPSWFENDQISDDFVASIPFLPIKEYVVTLAGKSSAWAQTHQLHGKRIGTVMGYIYPNTHTFTRVDFGSERELVRALDKKRVDAAIIGDLPALYWAKQFDISIALASIHSDGELVIRLHKSQQALLPQINQSLQYFIESGEIDAIVAKYADYHPAQFPRETIKP